MRVLVIGGGGYVAGLVLPALAQQHALRVFDPHAPADASCEYMSGSVTDLDALLRAAEGMESVLYMAMGAQAFGTSTGITTNLDVNIKGVHLALYTVQQAGIGQQHVGLRW